jgi:hypothetical protein
MMQQQQLMVDTTCGSLLRELQVCVPVPKMNVVLPAACCLFISKN